MKLLLILLNIYFVSFTDKPNSTTPALSPTALAMREANHIAIDELDYPVAETYLQTLQNKGVTIHHTSRWMNGATIETDDSTTIQSIRELPFVVSATMTRDKTKTSQISPRKNALQPHATTKYIDNDQLEIYNLLPIHALGYEGQGIRIAICDVGFYNANAISWVDSEHCLGYYDFTDEQSDFFGSTGAHGEYVLSFIAGNTTRYHGAAVNAHYYLMRSEEYHTESPKEMDNLIVAMETADSLGAHIFSASLGYYYFDNAKWNLSYSDLNGKKTRAARAATIASRKGMFVCLAAGNEGQNPWHYICCPSDADSILTVGAVTYERTIAAFSSRGPSADNRVKPEICALGQAAWYIAEDGITMVQGNGTSFATPLVSGMAASLWSAMPQLTNHQLRQYIIESADKYTNPNGDLGYGIPNAYKAYQLATQLHSIPATNSTPRKIMRNGMVYIIVNGKEYDVLGIRH